MAIYKCSKDLKGKVLDVFDIVIFGNLTYKVANCFLAAQDSWYNDAIFDRLHLNKLEFCTEHYKYMPGGGCWPTCKYNDFKALTNVVMALFKLIEGRNSKPSSDSKESKEFKYQEFKFKSVKPAKVYF